MAEPARQTRERRSRCGVLILTTLALVSMTAATWGRPPLALAYNASASAPLGWYRIEIVGSDAPLQVGDFVLARLPRAIAVLAAARGYVPESVPVLKRVAAVSGTHVCVANGTVRVAGDVVGHVEAADGRGRPLLAWRGCRVLIDGELFLLNKGNEHSFDSRYFGPLDRSFVLGRAMPLTTH